jgi:murein DD-endopeptidase MepM/ murein hydrolase activator NlpD
LTVWPVRGKIISTFGPKNEGRANDGIDIAAPVGTPVKVSGIGVVAYAGNELKGYGNLILVRHPDRYVTAYAWLSEMRVKRSDDIVQGQVIALTGQSGVAPSPQLHFEVRTGSTPVDPLTILRPD